MLQNHTEALRTTRIEISRNEIIFYSNTLALLTLDDYCPKILLRRSIYFVLFVMSSLFGVPELLLVNGHFTCVVRILS